MAEQQTISADKLCQLTGLSDRHHRTLAKAGHFPPPLASHYQTVPTIQGLFKYYRELADKKHGELAEEILRAKKAQRMNLEKDLAIKNSELRSAKEIADSLFALGEEIKATLQFKLVDQLPQLNDGLGAADQRANNKKAFLEILKRFQEWAAKWKA